MAVFEHWSASWPVLAGYLVAAAVHLVGLWRLRGKPTTGPEAGTAVQIRREAICYQFGLLLVLLALVSPVGYLADRYIWVRLLQELIVAVTGPGLIVLGAPWNALRAGLTGAPLPDTARLPRWLTAWPMAVVIAANVIWVGWQVPVLFDGAQRSAGLALIEHLSYLAAGLAYWLQLCSSRPFRQRTSALRRAGYVFGSVVVSSIFGITFVFGSSVFYPTYANSFHHVMTVLDDQQLAGAVWWMGMLPPLSVPAVALMVEWLNNEESDDLDRLLTPRKHGWPSRPVIR